MKIKIENKSSMNLSYLKYFVYITKYIYLSRILETHLSLLCKQC